MPKKRALSESESEHSDSSASSTEKVEKKSSPPPKKKKDSKSKSKSKPSCEEYEWCLSDRRKIRITQFKGKHYVMIRDFYEDSEGKMKPTKQGVNLSFDQWNQLKTFIPEIDEEIAKL